MARFDRPGRGGPGVGAKQAVVLGAEVLLERLRGPGGAAGEPAGGLVGDGTLPGCYAERYDAGFLAVFHSVVELTRNMLVSDLPHVASTAGVLAALAILREARAALAARGAGREQLAAAIDPGLPARLAGGAARLAGELEALAGEALEDTDALLLFGLGPGEDPVRALAGALPERELALLRFENWLVPFGNPPRPQIAPDGRAWPAPG